MQVSFRSRVCLSRALFRAVMVRPAGPPLDHGWQADHRAGALPAVLHAVIERHLRPLPSTITQGCDNLRLGLLRRPKPRPATYF